MKTADTQAKENAHLIPVSDTQGRQVGFADPGRELVERYYAYVRRVVWHVLGPSTDFEDVMQDALLAILKSASHLKDPGAERGWVRAVAVNTVRKHIRNRSRWFSRRANFDEEVLVMRVADPEARRVVRALYEALEGMSVDLRVVWTLRYISGATVDEVAAALDVSHSTAKRRIAKARERLEILAKKSPDLEHALARGGGDG